MCDVIAMMQYAHCWKRVRGVNGVLLSEARRADSDGGALGEGVRGGTPAAQRFLYFWVLQAAYSATLLRINSCWEARNYMNGEGVINCGMGFNPLDAPPSACTLQWWLVTSSDQFCHLMCLFSGSFQPRSVNWNWRLFSWWLWSVQEVTMARVVAWQCMLQVMFNRYFMPPPPILWDHCFRVVRPSACTQVSGQSHSPTSLPLFCAYFCAY